MSGPHGDAAGATETADRAARAPRTEAELLSRARAVAGHTVGDLGARLGVPIPEDQRRAKGLLGHLVERALGATAGSRGVPDFEALGIELKTLPLRRDGRPMESTFVCCLPLRSVAEVDWERSPVRAKLARVLWVPVEAERYVPLASRRIGTPVLWSPTGTEGDILAADWEELAGRVGAGDVEAITAHLGQALQVRPKGRHGRERRRAPDAGSAWLWTMPRGFYLRTWFTEAIVRRALA
ncbi:MAG: DNA mismatch repair endonuclease MutH [Myxococcota bacterium]